ncbi:MAG: hypothetical protein UY48_C0005G0035 [Candidatus Gottesmanbacteria bacterium GW2011_GWB1_49_7]|uniref:Uncharacterized protein n=1 Tax=Candidatus Gottesmanbacteria bacterium GW2011_GWB1_49_7 TaxID=1618448 RepID=A0A0G1Z2S6_9BACT|nr:MAG: hypothetical protein UY48_C0005G0035 [Candidatus Gottesmanbacteria bacterium GW2011_GWB1_49_7]
MWAMKDRIRRLLNNWAQWDADMLERDDPIWDRMTDLLSDDMYERLVQLGDERNALLRELDGK